MTAEGQAIQPVASDRRKWLALALLCVVQFMVVLDIAIVNVALPSIQVDLGFSQERPPVGDQRLRPRLRRVPAARRTRRRHAGPPPHLPRRHRRVHRRLAAGRAGLVRASLIGARALQGLGAAIITPAALSILSTTFAEGRERNIALGAWGAVGGFGAVAGVLLGGVLTDALSWEWIFFVNVPVGVAGFALAPLLLQESRDARGQEVRRAGAVLVTGGLSSLVYAITQAGQDGWLGPRPSSCSGRPWRCSPASSPGSCDTPSR